MAKKRRKSGGKRKPNPAFMKPLKVSATLAVVVGKGPMPRTQVVKKLWLYIKKHHLQDKKNKRNINADVALKAVFGGKKTVSMFEMTKLVSKHLS
jgi:upstream activation factor subunit UAF30